MNTVLINDAHLLVVEQGDARTHPVVFIHGFPFSHAMWQSQIAAVSRHFRAIAYDVRGLGGSSVGDGQYTIEGHVDDLIGFENIEFGVNGGKGFDGATRIGVGVRISL